MVPVPPAAPVGYQWGCGCVRPLDAGYDLRSLRNPCPECRPQESLEARQHNLARGLKPLFGRRPGHVARAEILRDKHFSAVTRYLGDLHDAYASSQESGDRSLEEANHRVYVCALNMLQKLRQKTHSGWWLAVDGLDPAKLLARGNQ